MAFWPDVFPRQDTSVSQASVPSLIKKRGGNPEGLAEFMVFYYERSAGFFQRQRVTMRDTSNGGTSVAGLASTPCFWSSFAQTPAARFPYAVAPDEYGRAVAARPQRFAS